jgi:hypothetical protein
MPLSHMAEIPRHIRADINVLLGTALAVWARVSRDRALLFAGQRALVCRRGYPTAIPARLLRHSELREFR